MKKRNFFTFRIPKKINNFQLRKIFINKTILSFYYYLKICILFEFRTLSPRKTHKGHLADKGRSFDVAQGFVYFLNSKQSFEITPVLFGLSNRKQFILFIGPNDLGEGKNRSSSFS